MSTEITDVLLSVEAGLLRSVSSTPTGTGDDIPLAKFVFCFSARASSHAPDNWFVMFLQKLQKYRTYESATKTTNQMIMNKYRVPVPTQFYQV